MTRDSDARRWGRAANARALGASRLPTEGSATPLLLPSSTLAGGGGRDSRFRLLVDSSRGDEAGVLPSEAAQGGRRDPQEPCICRHRPLAGAADPLRIRGRFRRPGLHPSGGERVRLRPDRLRGSVLRGGTRGRRRARSGRSRRDHRGRARCDGSRQQRMPRSRWPIGRVQHRAAVRAGHERVRRSGHRLPVLLRSQDDVRQVRRGLRGLPGRFRDAGRAVRGAHPDPDRQGAPLPRRSVRLELLVRTGGLAPPARPGRRNDRSGGYGAVPCLRRPGRGRAAHQGSAGPKATGGAQGACPRATGEGRRPVTERTEEIPSTDAYQTWTEATLVEVSPEGVVLDRTVFYARGGGQPGDTGWLRWNGGQVRVNDTFKQSGIPVHAIEGEPPPDGTSVTAEIDWDRRHVLMRTHTALHALSGIIWRDYGAKVTGGNMEPGVARMDFELESMSSEFGKEVEAKLNQELDADRPVRVEFLSRLEAMRDPDLIRTKVNLIPETIDPIRVVPIEGLDRQEDGGTHVRSTGEVGPVRVIKTESKGKAFKRMRIELHRSDPGG